MPRLWTETIEAHRNEVRNTILDTTWTLVNEHGLTSVTMSQIAHHTGIGRATLYKYFPDVEAILLAWHDRHTTRHLEQLIALRDQPGSPARRLAAVLHAYGVICHRRGHHATDLIALLHRGEHVGQTQQRLRELIQDLLVEVAATDRLRDDLLPAELATYCLHALTAAGDLPSEDAVHRLVTVTLAALQPSPENRE